MCSHMASLSSSSLCRQCLTVGGDVWAAFREPLRWSRLDSESRENQCFFSLSPSISLARSLSFYFPFSISEAVDWTGEEGLGCDVFRAAINKSVPAQALWNPEPLYPFHVFPMSQGPDLRPPGPWLSYLKPKRPCVCVYVYVCVWDWLRMGMCWRVELIRGWLSHDPVPPSLRHLTPSTSPTPPSSFHRL